MIETRLHGTVESGFEPVRDAFAANFEKHAEVGAACSVHVHGKLVVDLWGGTYLPDTLQMVASTTKGVVTIAAHMLAQEGRLDFDAPVTNYWPEFGAEGKGDMPVRWLFSHRAGLAVIDRPLTMADALAWDPVIEALAAQKPVWDPNSTHGYHVGTFGWLAGEIVRRASGKSVGAYVAEKISRPLHADFWIGLPEDLHGRVSPLIPAPPPSGPPDIFTARLMDPSTLLHRAFVNPMLLPGTLNEPAFWKAEVPAANGIGTARGLSRIYAATVGEIDGVRLLSPETLDRAIREQSAGEDVVLGYVTRYGTGFQLPFPFRPMAGGASFGHYGMGGSVAFADPERGLSFAYVMNQMQASGGVDPRSAGLVEALQTCLR